MTAAAATPSAPSAPTLPRLRSDLQYSDASPDISGEGGCVIHDPLRHKFFRISTEAAVLLDYFTVNPSRKIETISQDDQEQLEAVTTFLKQSRLVEANKEDQASLLQEHQRSQKSILSQLVHGYISFRIPLFNPERFLDATLPLVKIFATRWLVIFLTVLATIGIYFTSRQWDQFSSSVASSFSLSGAASYAFTVVVLKIFHELGHAYVARNYGCNVPLVGITFMVMVPMLFTDATDAWRLKSDRQRFNIAAAGVVVEFALAAIAIFLWAFLPEGSWRQICFFVAVTAWVMSVLVNLSPFMRFDGYHMVVDILGMHSLAPRSFKIANWFLRETLFKLNDPPPEFFPTRLRNGLILFAFGTMLYRLSLFLGIAWLVYVSLPKVIGLPMAVVEVWFFILMPIIRELKEWKAMELKTRMNRTRSILSATIVVGLFVLLALPLDRHVSVPGILVPAQEAWIYPIESAEIIAIHASSGDKVKSGQVLMQLSAPDIINKLNLATLRRNVIEEKLSRIAADAKSRAQAVILQRDLLTVLREIEGLHQRQNLLTVTAPVDGIVSSNMASLHSGMWVGQQDLLFHIFAPQSATMSGLLVERDIGRIARNAEAVFIAEDGARAAVSGHVKDIGMPGGEGQTLKYLSAQYGGAIDLPQQANAAAEQKNHGHLPITLAANGPSADTAVVGTITIDAAPQSFFGYAFGRIVTVALRESGF